MSLEFPGIIFLQIQVTTTDFESWIHYWTMYLKDHAMPVQCCLGCVNRLMASKKSYDTPGILSPDVPYGEERTARRS